jgi:hypothetical protein
LQDDKDFSLSILFKDLFFETLSLIFYNSATDAGIKDIREYLFKLVYTVRTEVTEHDIICKFYSKLIKERETIMASAKEGRTVLQMDIYQFGNPSQATIKAINDTLSIVKIRVGEVESSSRNILTSLNFQPGTNSKPIGRRRMLIKPIEEDINDLPDLVWPEKDEQESDPLLNTTINYARPG